MKTYLIRAIDYIFQASIATVLLIIFLPVFLWIIWKIGKESNGPIFFIQERVGLNGNSFKIYKFRTMYQETKKEDPFICTNYEDPRITEFGKFLRRKKLDELPQLINVIKGEMRFVGPRPEIPFFHEKNLLEVENWQRRVEVKPGITGFAQIHPTISHNPHEKIIEDIRYVENHGLLLDMELMFKTFWAWVRRRVL